MNLVIVESPAKARTISEYLGKEYKVLASFGHVRDLPKSKIGIDMGTFEPEYVIPTKSRKTATLLKNAAKEADKIILATDEDREGEAIAWHLTQALDAKNVKAKMSNAKYERIVFHEITKEAILNALKNPRVIDMKLVDAQQGRRVLDRLVGYNLSPLLWNKIRRGLSAGRVQSVAVKFIVDREREREAFKPEEYWEIVAQLTKYHLPDTNFEAKLIKKDDKNIEINSKKEADKALEDLNKDKYLVEKVEVRDQKKNPPAPFITSSLQQEAARKLRFSAKKTMMLAQRLYEGKQVPGLGSTGLITYMRTDSRNLSEQSLAEIRKYIKDNFGNDYLPETARRFIKAKGAQEAHEAIRPTSVLRTPELIGGSLEADELKLYQLIWERTLACQMNEEILTLTSVDIKAGEYLLRANGKTVKFPGFSKVYLEGSKKSIEEEKREIVLPKLEKGDECNLKELIPSQKFTQPPARYSEATLIKALEENGIGRPSTYAPTLSTIKDRGYVVLENRYFVPEKIGYIVNDLLVDNFPELVNVEFTAVMERELDDIAEGKLGWKEPIKEMWHLIENQLKQAEDNIEKINTDEKTDEICELCGKPMVIKTGRFGRFLACTGFPDCKNTKPIVEKAAGKCPTCKEGDVVIKRTRRGRIFYGCSRYPECDWATWKLKQNDES